MFFFLVDLPIDSGMTTSFLDNDFLREEGFLFPLED
jgi:hypothetical protein